MSATDIERIDGYDDLRFSQEVLDQHGAFLAVGRPWAFRVISGRRAVDQLAADSFRGTASGRIISLGRFSPRKSDKISPSFPWSDSRNPRYPRVFNSFHKVFNSFHSAVEVDITSVKGKSSGLSHKFFSPSIVQPNSSRKSRKHSGQIQRAPRSLTGAVQYPSRRHSG